MIVKRLDVLLSMFTREGTPGTRDRAMPAQLPGAAERRRPARAAFERLDQRPFDLLQPCGDGSPA